MPEPNASLERSAPFIQIQSVGINRLVALDADGIVWEYFENAVQLDQSYWMPIALNRIFPISE